MLEAYFGIFTRQFLFELGWALPIAFRAFSYRMNSLTSCLFMGVLKDFFR